MINSDYLSHPEIIIFCSNCATQLSLALVELADGESWAWDKEIEDELISTGWTVNEGEPLCEDCQTN